MTKHSKSHPTTSVRWSCIWPPLLLMLVASLPDVEHLCSADIFTNMSGSHYIYAITTSIILTDDNVIHVYGKQEFSLALQIQGSNYVEDYLMSLPPNLTATDRFESSPIADFHRSKVTYRLSEWIGSSQLPAYAHVTLQASFKAQASNQTNHSQAQHTEASITKAATVMLQRRFRIAIDESYVLLMVDNKVYHLGDTVTIWADFLRPSNWAVYYNETIGSSVGSNIKQASLNQTDEGETEESEIEEEQPEESQTFPSNVTENVILQIYNGADQLMGEWTENEVRKAQYNIKYQLPKSGAIGQWSVRTLAPTAQVTFSVISSYKVEPSVFFNHKSHLNNIAEVDVCITGTDRLPISGRIKIQQCFCSLPGNYGPVSSMAHRLPTHVSDIIFRYRTCPKIQAWLTPAPCSFTHAFLNYQGCLKTNLTGLVLVSYTGQRPIETAQYHLFCVQFYDSTTGGHHSICKVASGDRERSLRSKHLEITPKYYKPGLPTTIKARLLTELDVNGEIEVTIVSNPKECPLAAKIAGPRPYYLKLAQTFDAKGELDLLLPPLKHYGSLRVQFNSNSGDAIGGRFGVREPHCYISLSDEVIQVWTTEDSLPVSDCVDKNESVTFTLVGNAPLAGVHLLAYVNFRGSLLELIVDNAPGARETCIDQDGPFGHYTCSSVHAADQITCGPGWKGDNCLTPVCAKQCDPVGGQCSQPGECNCNPGFHGKWCDRCSTCGPCNSGFECSCPWYNRTCNINSVLHMRPVYNELQANNSTTPLPANVTTEYIPKRTIYTREVTLHSQPNLRGNFTVIFGYFKNIPSTDRIDFVFTEVKLHKPNTCPDSVIGPGIFFNETSAVIGSDIEVVVLPPQNADWTDESTTCHVRVWEVTPDNERMAALFSAAQLGEHFYHTFESGFTPKYHTDWILQHAHLSTLQNKENLKLLNIPYDCVLSDNALNGPHRSNIPPISELSFDSIFTTTSKLDQLDSQRGIVQPIKVIPIGKTWKASAFCYGQDIGVWTATTEKDFTIDRGFAFNITGARHVKVMDKFYLTATLWYDHKKLPNPTDCYEVTIKFIYDDEFWNVFVPNTRVECSCGHGIKSRHQFTNLIQAKLPAQSVTINAEVSVRLQDCQFQNLKTIESPPDNAFVIKDTTNGKRTPDTLLNHLTTHVLQVTEGENLISRQVSVIFAHPGSVKSTIRIKLNSIIRSGQQGSWVEIIYSCLPMTALIRRFDRLFSTTPLWTVRHHLAILKASITVLHYSTLNFAGSTSSLQPIVAKAILQAHTSATWINRYECPDKAVILGSYLGDCQVPGDPWLLLSVLEVLCEMISIPYPWRTSTMDNYLLLFRVAEYFKNKLGESVNGCLKYNKSVKLSLNEDDYALTARLYVALSQKTYEEGYEQIYALQQAIQSKASQCLLKSLPSRASFISFSTTSLSYIARALQQIKPDHQLTETVFGEIERRRQTNVNTETNIDVSFWSLQAGKNGPGDLETTASAFLVYIARSDLPEIDTIQLNIVRWLYQKQDRNGAFYTPQMTIPAISALFQYSIRQKDWINDIKPHLPLKIKVYSPVVGDFKFDGRLLAADRGLGHIRVLQVPQMDILTEIFVEIHTEQPRDLLSLRINALYETSPSSTTVTPQSKRFHVTFLPDFNASCPLTKITMCIENRNVTDSGRILLLKISPQSGWDWTADMHETTAKQMNVFATELPLERLGIDFTQILRLVLNPKRNSSCIQLHLEWTGIVVSPRPLTVEVFEQGSDEHLTVIDYPMSDCQPKVAFASLTNEKLFIKHPRMPNNVLVCPVRVRPLDEVPEAFISELTEVCADYPAFILHFLPLKNSEIPVDVYQITAFGKIDVWSTRLHSTARRCPGLEDDQVFLALPRTMIDFQPQDEYLNLNAFGLVSAPVALLELGDIEQQDAFRILNKAADECKQYNTVLKVADSLLPQSTA